MKALFKFVTSTTLCCLFVIPVWSQLIQQEVSPHLSPRELAVLSARVKKRSDDTVKVNILLKIGEHLLDRVPNATATDSAIALYQNVEKISRRIKYDSGVVSGLIGRARILIIQRETRLKENENDSSRFEPIDAIYQQVLLFAKSRYNAEKVGDIYSRLGKLTWRNHNNAPHMRILFDSAAAYYHRAHKRDKESIALSTAGHCFHEISLLDSAEARYIGSIEVMDGAKRKGLSMSHSLLGNTYLYRGDSKRALQQFLTAYDLAVEHDDTTDCDFGLVNLFIGFTYQDLKQPDMAVKHHLVAMNVFARHEKTNPGDLTHAAANAAKLMIGKNPRAAIDLLLRLQKDHPIVLTHRTNYIIPIRLMTAYMALRDYKNAKKYYEEAMKILATRSPSFGLALYSEIISYQIVSGKLPDAEKFLKAYRDRVAVQKGALSQYYYLQHKLDSMRGDYKSALVNYTRFKAVSDSLLDQAKVKEMTQLNVAFETEKKEQAIALLKRDAEIADIRLGEEKRIRNGMVAGALVLGLILVLMFNLYRSKKRSSDQLQIQKNEIALKNNVLQRLIDEKEWLLKEVHHRVKNNLQTIVSLLESQAIYLKNAEALSAIQDSQNRVNAMSLIHQKLYQSESITTINMSVYINELVHYLMQSFVNHQRGVRFDIQVDDVELDVSQAIPVGLILNEAITNSMKYAFPTSGENIISVAIKERDSEIKITVADNGIGIPPDIDIREEYDEGLGLQLIEGLTKDLKGALKISSEQGVRIDISFSANTHLESVAMR